VQRSGLTVSSLSETSDTYRNGLRNGDVIVSVDGEDVRNCSSSTVLNKLRTSKSSKVVVELLPSVKDARGNGPDASARRTTVSNFYRASA